jgi:hypothetical protein
MLDLNGELESTKIRILEIEKSIASQMRVLRKLSDRGMDKTLGERMLDLRRHNLRRSTVHAGLLKARIATTSQLEKIAERSSERASVERASTEAVAMQNNLA